MTATGTVSEALAAEPAPAPAAGALLLALASANSSGSSVVAYRAARAVRGDAGGAVAAEEK
jgi:hypothetical protein